MVLKLFHMTGHSGNLPRLFNGSSVPRVTDHISGKRCPASCSLWPGKNLPHALPLGGSTCTPLGTRLNIQDLVIRSPEHVKMKKAEALSSVE